MAMTLVQEAIQQTVSAVKGTSLTWTSAPAGVVDAIVVGLWVVDTPAEKLWMILPRKSVPYQMKSDIACC